LLTVLNDVERTAKKAAPAADGDKKKRKRSRKETYSSYIYKGTLGS
jgi:histone H2B